MTPSIFTSIINSYLPEPHAQLLNGILFGINLKTNTVFYTQLKQVGLLHLVVLSGINITLLASIIGSLTWYLGKKISILITILIIIIFIIFVGPKAPIIRAGFMGILTLVSTVYGRKTVALYLLLLSALFTAVFWPKWIGSISFHLSYAATAGIILFGQVQLRQYHQSSWRSKLKQSIWKELKPSLAAQLFTVPVIFFYFRQISTVAPLSNLLVSPLVAPLMIFGFLTVILGKIGYIFGLVPSFICYALLTYMIAVVEFLSKVPLTFFQF